MALFRFVFYPRDDNDNDNNDDEPLTTLVSFSPNLDLLNGLETNVNYFDDPASPDAEPDNASWQSWNMNTNKGWYRKGAWGGRQRLHTYSTDQPVDLSGSGGQTQAVRRRLPPLSNLSRHLSRLRAGHPPCFLTFSPPSFFDSIFYPVSNPLSQLVIR